MNSSIKKKSKIDLFSFDKSFFDTNISDINRMVCIILFSSVIVPILFILISLTKFWFVPTYYSVILISYLLSTGTIVYFLNLRKETQFVSMYTGIISAIMFVNLLALKGYINITVSFAFGPMLSCLYYNRRLSRTTTITAFMSAVAVFWVRSYSVTPVSSGTITQFDWFIANIIGIFVEFIFVFLITDFISKRTGWTINSFVGVLEEKNEATRILEEQKNNISRLNSDLEAKNAQLTETHLKIMQFVSQCLGSHDLFTGHHVIHTQKYVEIICKELVKEGYYLDELTEENIQLFSVAALLHDIGKIHIPEGILNKLGKFTPEEFEMMKSHPVEGAKLIDFLPPIEDGKFNEIAKKMALYHHEKWDGSGYPMSIAGEKIPLCARIMACADVLDALLSMRLYKEAMTIDEAMDVFEKSKGQHFEPVIADAVLHSRIYIELVDRDFKISESSSNARELDWWKRYHNIVDQNG